MSTNYADTEEGSIFIRHEPCPRCRQQGGDRDGNNLARYSDGHGHCFSCGYYEKGDGCEVPTNNHQEKKNSNLLDVSYADLKARCLVQDTCRVFGYGVSKYHGVLCHVAPYYDQSGNLVAQHIRMDGKEFRWLGDTKGIKLFGQNLWKHGGKRLVITEGEIDCLSISQLQGNKWPVVSLPNGAQSAVKNIKDNLEWVSSFDEIVLAFDMDDEGRKSAQAVAEILPVGHVFIPSLPEKDANECLKHNQGQRLITSLWQAEEYRPDGIKSGLDLWDDLMKPPAVGYDTPFTGLNAKLHGFRKGELYLFTAGSGIGKSTIVNEIAYHLKMKHGLSLGILALEESPARNARRYLGIHLNKPIHLPEVFRTVPEAEMKRAFQEVMGDGKWWIYDHFGSSNIDTLLNKIRYMITGLGCDVIVIDHVSIIVSGLDDAGNDERKTIDMLMTRLRSLVEETGAMVLAVVHLKRPDGKGKSFNEGRQVSLTDLRGSGSLEQLSDAVIALERDQQSEENPNRSTIRILKNRPIGITGEAGYVDYDQETGRLMEASPFDKKEQEDDDEDKDF